MSSSVQTERLWQRLKHAGYGTRGMITQLIASGTVLVDGRVPTAVTPLSESSVVTVRGRAVAPVLQRQYWMLNKPVGMDCCIQPDRPDSIAHLLATLPPGLFPVGRLDKDSSGLLLLTNDGRLCQRLMHPSHRHEKEYTVVVDKDLSAPQVAQLRSGTAYRVGPHSYQPRPCTVVQTACREFRIILTEGMYRQIRFMCRAAGLRVLSLRRIRLNRLLLGELPPGAVRELGPDELQSLEA